MGLFSGSSSVLPGYSSSGTPRKISGFIRKEYKGLKEDYLEDPMLIRAQRQAKLFSPAQIRQQSMQAYLSGINEQLGGLRSTLAARGGGGIGGAEQGARVRGQGMMQAILGGQQAGMQAMQPNLNVLGQKYNILSALFGSAAGAQAQTASAISQRDVGITGLTMDFMKDLMNRMPGMSNMLGGGGGGLPEGAGEITAPAFLFGAI